MTPFLLSFFVAVSLAAPKILPPAFEYWGSDRPDLLMKMQCVWDKYPQTMTCQGTKARIVAPTEKEAEKFVNSEIVGLMDKETETFEDDLHSACDWTPADKFAFNGSYHKARDAFLAELEKAKASLCESKNAKALKKSWASFEKFTSKICELRYQRFEVKFAKERGEGWRWNASYKNTQCDFPVQQVLTYDPKGEVSPWAFEERLDHKVGRREIAACEGKDAPVSAKFAATYPTKKPPGCEFILDRERSWECCAFED